MTRPVTCLLPGTTDPVPVSLCLFASTPDISSLGFIVRVLTGSIEELPARAIEWGYDGVEFMLIRKEYPSRLPWSARSKPRALSCPS